MTRMELQVWHANIPHVRAEEVLREHGGSLSPEQLEQATFLSTGDREEARLARIRRWLQIQRQQQMKE